MKKKYLEIGKITSVFGVRGEVKVLPMCDSPQLLTEFDTLYWKSGTPLTIENARVHKNMAVVKIQGVDTADDAAKLRNHLLYVDREDMQLEQGSYFIADLIGLKVLDADSGEEYGVVTDVIQNPANDIYCIKTADNRELMLPAAPGFIAETDIEAGFMRISPPKGLFEIYGG